MTTSRSPKRTTWVIQGEFGLHSQEERTSLARLHSGVGCSRMFSAAGPTHRRLAGNAFFVRESLGEVSHQAVYDVLRALTGAGLLRRIQPSGSVARYEARVGDNHHHIVCRGCGAIADVDCAVGERPCLSPGDAQGFVLDEAEVTFWGLCPDCQARRRAESAL